MEIINLCPDCLKKKEEAESHGVVQSDESDKFKRRREALAKAEKCRYFCHHTLFDYLGKEDPLTGSRTCSLKVKAGCGHEISKYNLCMDWVEGKDCHDFGEREAK